MNRRFFYLVGLITLFGLSAVAVADDKKNPFDADFSKVQIKTTDLGHGLYALEGLGGNIGVSIGDDGVFLVDDQFAPLNDKIKAAIRKLTSKPVSYLINTHWHPDHTGGNEQFARAGTLVFAHENVRARMTSEQQFTLTGEKILPAPAEALPVITFSSDLTFHINGLEVQVIHVKSAHTDGDSIVYFRGANVIHMGDLFFKDVFPFIDSSSGGSLKGLIAACDLALALMNRETKVIPGHGSGLTTWADFRTYVNMLKRVRKLVRNHIRLGHSIEETLSANPLEKLEERWGGGRIKAPQFTSMVYKIIDSGG